MAQLTVQTLSTAGVTLSFAAASTSDTFLNNGRTFLYVKNGQGSSEVITINSLVNCDQGFDHDITVTVGAGSEACIGPFPQSRYNNSSGLVTVTMADATTITVAAVSL